MNTENVALIKAQPIAMAESHQLSTNDIIFQIKQIMDLKKDVMKDGEHYGIIPGTNKPTLYKSGAEKFALVFRFAADYVVTRLDLENNHREYEVKCNLTHITSGRFVGAGIGSCSTLEKKYRYRSASNDEMTGFSVPKLYWDRRKENASNEELNRILASTVGESGIFKTKKDGATWVIVKKTHDDARVENPDIADTYNTVLKMAKKRAYVDAVLTATGGSDFFTQDVEDFVDMQEAQVVESEPKSSVKAPGAKSEEREQLEHVFTDYAQDKTAAQISVAIGGNWNNDVTQLTEEQLHRAIAKWTK